MTRPSLRTIVSALLYSALTSAMTTMTLDAQTAAPPASCAALNNACPDLYPPGPLNLQRVKSR